MRFAVLKGRGTVHQLLLFQLLAGKVKHSPLSNEIKSAIALIIYTFFTLNHKQIQSLLFCSDDRISKYYSLLAKYRTKILNRKHTHFVLDLNQ